VRQLAALLYLTQGRADADTTSHSQKSRISCVLSPNIHQRQLARSPAWQPRKKLALLLLLLLLLLLPDSLWHYAA
jgi:hypothetical protein